MHAAQQIADMLGIGEGVIGHELDAWRKFQTDIARDFFLKDVGFFVQSRKDFIHIMTAERHDIDARMFKIRAGADFGYCDCAGEIEQIWIFEMSTLERVGNDVTQLFANTKLALRRIIGCAFDALLHLSKPYPTTRLSEIIS